MTVSGSLLPWLLQRLPRTMARAGGSQKAWVSFLRLTCSHKFLIVEAVAALLGISCLRSAPLVVVS